MGRPTGPNTTTAIFSGTFPRDFCKVKMRVGVFNLKACLDDNNNRGLPEAYP